MPPARTTASTVLSASSTAKCTSQCGGMPSSMLCMSWTPPTVWPWTLNPVNPGMPGSGAASMPNAW